MSDEDDDETLFKCQDLIAWKNNPILMWGHQLMCYIGNQFHVEWIELIMTVTVLKQC